jgi:hypothetical protein
MVQPEVGQEGQFLHAAAKPFYTKEVLFKMCLFYSVAACTQLNLKNFHNYWLQAKSVALNFGTDAVE